MAPQHPKPLPGQTTQMIPQPGGQPIQVKPAHSEPHQHSHRTRSQTISSTSSTRWRIDTRYPSRTRRSQYRLKAKPGTTPGAITGPDQQVSKIILPSTTAAQEGSQLDSRLRPGMQPAQPGQPLDPGMAQQTRTPLGPGQTNSNDSTTWRSPTKLARTGTTPGMSQDQITNHLKYFFHRVEDRHPVPFQDQAESQPERLNQTNNQK
ncbi:hypothetical protein AVEN_40619-1 [Araneus ventricosus]|uniref:Uncharacterized protein n=1 Tax=Araneus ventricosus TaxID=182803 RepID=A0A4Y2J9T9_ARAVE|nr:hypothetical protein AVEN_40619-1 [Araneus ventricosus]